MGSLYVIIITSKFRVTVIGVFYTQIGRGGVLLRRCSFGVTKYSARTSAG